MIELRDVAIRVGDCRLDGLSCTIASGRYAVVMGATGVGKTTILEAICGLRRLAAGQILMDNNDVTHWSPADRSIGYVPQDLALFPTLSVREHLGFAMRIRRQRAEQINQRIDELASLLQIDGLLGRGVQNLSGGEAQRVALGRALSFRPSVLLLDEPLSALDSSTHQSTLEMLRQINIQTGVTVMHVTHNQAEADALGDVCVRLSVDSDKGNVVMSS